VIDCSILQASLNTYYEQLRRQEILPRDIAEAFSAPLIVHIYPEWLQTRRRLLIFGRETRGWGLNAKHHRNVLGAATPGFAGACQGCSFRELLNFHQFTEREDAVRALEHAYDVFDLGLNEQIVRYDEERIISRSQFWRAFHEIMVAVEGSHRHAALWSNLICSDCQDGPSFLSRGPMSGKFIETQREILAMQLQVLQPQAVVFFVGKAYKRLLEDYLFPGLEFSALEDGRPEVLKVSHNSLPAKTVWSLHPRGLQQASAWDLVGRIAAWIAEG